ncbi:hypothetical protein SRB5_39100 [Streptomyces sp. RB5]|uniref:Uncharacterized protein n=1 Tax=Streptomyces smaragdinus TaxID=2585196 RepID=A0A7K0CJW2_9ACTN|nr:hypothetical protein [Streptomyces smaragdinus]MQY13758.1 hypothetical protein [Streptomyces smaragdinus]
MSTRPRTASVNVYVHKPLTVDEPAWCAGHPDALPQFKTDVLHNGPEQIIAPGGRAMFRAFITQAPFATNPDARTAGLYVEAADITATYSPNEVEQLAADLVEAAAVLRVLGRDMAVRAETGVSEA